jgi:hypothetical protein
MKKDKEKPLGTDCLAMRSGDGVRGHSANASHREEVTDLIELI